MGDHKEAKISFEKSKSYAEAIKYYDGTVGALNSLGPYCISLDNPTEVIKHFKLALELRTERKCFIKWGKSKRLAKDL